MSIDVVVIDDHTLLRAALCDTLRMEDDVHVVADAPSAAVGVVLVAQHKPDIVILDVEIPGEEVKESIQSVVAASPQSHILIVSMYEDQGLIQELLALGIAGYLHKSVTREALLAAIRGLTEGNEQVVVYVSRQSHTQRTPPEPLGNGSSLTARELEVIAYVADARSNRQIAGMLGITEGTVKRHLRNIFDKLDAVSRLDAVNRATAAKLIPPRPTGAARPL